MYLENRIYFQHPHIKLLDFDLSVLTVFERRSTFFLEVLLHFVQKNDLPTRIFLRPLADLKNQVSRSNPRPISTGQLHTLLHFHSQPIYLVVFKGSYFLKEMGYLILRGASRLDAFSVYPCQTWLPGYGPGGPTGAPEVCPPRSSRTKGSSSQISYAHAG